MKAKSTSKPQEIFLQHPGKSFLINAITGCNLPFHFHAEIEILFCLNGTGTIMAGNYVNSFGEGDLFMIGKNLPHALIQTSEEANLICLQFDQDFLGKRFFYSREFKSVEDLLKRSSRGLKFKIDKEKFLPVFTAITSGESIVPVVSVLKALDLLSKERFESLNSIQFTHDAMGESDLEKINKVFDYTQEHFQETISLEQVSNLLNFTETSFCRYFKLYTGKSYFQYLNEIRIANACKLLIEFGNHDIEEICFSCGFNNPSTFYKQFKKIVKLTPKEYQVKAKKTLQSAVTMVA